MEPNPAAVCAMKAMVNKSLEMTSHDALCIRADKSGFRVSVWWIKAQTEVPPYGRMHLLRRSDGMSVMVICMIHACTSMTWALCWINPWDSMILLQKLYTVLCHPLGNFDNKRVKHLEMITSSSWMQQTVVRCSFIQPSSNYHWNDSFVLFFPECQYSSLYTSEVGLIMQINIHSE